MLVQIPRNITVTPEECKLAVGSLKCRTMLANKFKQTYHEEPPATIGSGELAWFKANPQTISEILLYQTQTALVRRVFFSPEIIPLAIKQLELPASVTGPCRLARLMLNYVQIWQGPVADLVHCPPLWLFTLSLDSKVCLDLEYDLSFTDYQAISDTSMTFLAGDVMLPETLSWWLPMVGVQVIQWEGYPNVCVFNPQGNVATTTEAEEEEEEETVEPKFLVDLQSEISESPNKSVLAEFFNTCHFFGGTKILIPETPTANNTPLGKPNPLPETEDPICMLLIAPHMNPAVYQCARKQFTIRGVTVPADCTLEIDMDGTVQTWLVNQSTPIQTPIQIAAQEQVTVRVKMNEPDKFPPHTVAAVQIVFRP